MGLCPSGSTPTTAKSGTTTTTAKNGTTSSTAKSGSTTTSITAVGGAVTNTNVPTQVLGENFSKPGTAAAATSLANTGNSFPPVIAVGLVLGGLGLVGAGRRVSGRRLESSMRRLTDHDG